MRVDPMKYRAEFEKVLKKNNWSFREILKKSLEWDLSELKPSSGVDREVSGSEAFADSPTVEASKMEKKRQDKIQKHQGLSQKLQAETAQGTKANQTNFAEKASERSKRRKVNTRLEADGPDSVRIFFVDRGSYLRRTINTSDIVDFGDTKQFGGPHKSVTIWRIRHRKCMSEK
ncbi:hypothetical protein MRB53_023448 [Persea americana]|uniref:Uncharacterized protein n=1 Tax=Persea americana TaxID=3435 RepID=A0ACC2LA39_PERAE|nr:hypothetical protein MRB53_023448 [Persea americana]